MFFDANLFFAEDQAYSSATSSEVDVGKDIGNSDDAYVRFTGTNLAAAGNMTVDVQASATSGSGHATRGLFTFTPAELNEGVDIPLNLDEMDRYVQLVIGGTPTAGTWTAALADGRGRQTAK